MGTAAQPAELSELLKNMKVDTHTKGTDVAEAVPKKDGLLTDLNRVVSSPSPTSSNGDFTSSNGWVPETCVYYASGYPSHGYVYDYGQGGGEWDEYSQQYVGVNAADLHSSGLYTENGSVLYHTGYGYPASGAYGPYTSGPIHAIGADGQLYGPAAFQYPGAIYQPQGTQYLSPVVMGGDSVAENGTMASGCTTTNITTANMTSRPGFSMALIAPHNPYQRGLVPMAMHNYDSRYPSWNEKKERKSKPAANRVGPNTGNGTTQSSQNFKTSVSQAASTPALPGALGKGFPPLSKTVPNSNGSAKTVAAPSSNGPGKLNGGTTNGIDLKATNNVWNSLDKVKQNGGLPVSSNNCSSNSDILDEQNKGPRTRVKVQRPCLGIVKHFRGQNGILNGNIDCIPATKEQYNKSDFITSYADAKFFVIKSYSEDDVHKSIKYNVWASTPNGNKRLDAAYQEAQSRAASKGSCPVFLFFSVNASGQFCGLAEMCGSVDFNKSMDFWQQDKWNGRFSVKWHVIKDIPNSQFRHIILENNDNKPVTNSRDTQEVKFQQGIEMLKIFKSYPSKASILDDFQFYENRQRAMQEKRSRHQQQNSLQGQQQISIAVKAHTDEVPNNSKETHGLVALKAHTDEVPNNLKQAHGLVAVKAHTDEISNTLKQTHGNGKASHLAGAGVKPAATEIENVDKILKSERLPRSPIEKGDDKPEMASQNSKEELQVKHSVEESEEEISNSEVEVASEEGEKKREKLSSGISNEEKAVE